jgi:Mg2+/Co2+ transporter CorB
MSALSLFFLILSIIFLFFLSGFLSGSETAFLSLNRVRLRHLVKKNVPRAKSTQYLIENIDHLIATILISNNFVNVAISSLAAATFYYFLGPQVGIITSTIVITILILVFSEITPKIFAAGFSEKYAFKVVPIISFIVRFMRPVSGFFTKFSNYIIAKIGIIPESRSRLVSEEEIRTMIEVGREEGAVEDQERKMLHRIFEFNDINVSEVMIPRSEIVAADVNCNINELLNLVVKEGYARIPIYEDELDNLIGVMYSRDLLKISKNKKGQAVRNLIRPAYLVPENKKAMDLLRDFQRKRIQIALVKDKENKIVGLVSLEDLLEEIVGEIEDWHD